MGAKDSERERLVKAHAWIRLFADGRTLNGCNEEGVWFDRLPQKRADGSIFITTTIRPWADVEVDLKAYGVAAPDLTRGELAAKRALGLAVALLLVLMAGCARNSRICKPPDISTLALQVQLHGQFLKDTMERQLVLAEMLNQVLERQKKLVGMIEGPKEKL